MSTHIHITTHAYEKQTVGCNIYTLAFSYTQKQHSLSPLVCFDMTTISLKLDFKMQISRQVNLTWKGERDEQEYLSWVVLINQTFIGESYITL